MNRKFVLILALAGAAGLVLPGSLQAQSSAAVGCELCHGELEFLRAQTGSLVEAERLFATTALGTGSAHDGMDCAECHTGYARFPHAGLATTRSCGSCHEAEAAVWQRGVHADPGTADPVSCTACHDVHDVMDGNAMDTDAGAGRMNAYCTVCHESSHLPGTSPHARTVPCAGCHAPHETRLVDHDSAWIAAANQHRTCAVCHEEETSGWPDDAHGTAVASPAAASSEHEPPSCTSCHGGHDMLAREEPGFAEAIVERCSACHEHEAETYLETYHGQASALGSEIVATCSACHGHHDVLSPSDSASSVAKANLLATCGECHRHARASFVQYDSHPEPGNRERSAVLYYSFVFMNGLLISVFAVFGVHAALWWIRLLGGGDAVRVGERRDG